MFLSANNLVNKYLTIKTEVMNQSEFLSKKNISMYRDLVKPLYVASVEEIHQWITGTKFKTISEQLRQLYKEGKTKEASDLKKTIPAFTASGLCRDRRILKNLWAYSQYIVLDLDDLSPGQLDEAKARAINIPYTVLAFISPSGYGLKILVKVDSTSTHHKQAYAQVKKFYEEELGHSFDNTDDAVRLCFLSYDPAAYLNAGFETFHVDSSSTIPATPLLPTSRNTDSVNNKDVEGLIAKAINYTERKSQFTAGSRNNFVFLLSCNCNKMGIPQDTLYSMCLKKYQSPDFDAKEIDTIISSAYKKTEEFGTWKQFDSVHPEAAAEDGSLDLIPDAVYGNLPSLLKSIVSHFNPNHERDLMLLTVFAVCSTLFPHVHGKYDRKRIGLNLYLFITAPASAGKGVITWARDLTIKICDYLSEKYNSLYQNYRNEYNTYLMDKKNNPAAAPPEEPKEPHLLIPANTSSSMLIDILNVNKHFAVIFETEGDALFNTLKNDWGNFSDIIRNAFHHERVAKARIGNSKKVSSINNPFISMVLSATINAYKYFTTGMENGFFSRFIQYSFSAPVVWEDKFGDEGDDLESIFEGYSELFLTQWKKYENAKPIRIFITPEQRKKFFHFFESKLTQLYADNGGEIVACVKRHAIIAYRIAMLLTIFRQLSAGAELDKDLYIDDVDYESTILITEVLLKHLEKVFVRIQGENKTTGRIPRKHQLCDLLPDSFTTAESNEIAATIGISPEYADKLRNQLCKDGLIESIGYGKFIKKKK
jgi:hypothetical protein